MNPIRAAALFAAIVLALPVAAQAYFGKTSAIEGDNFENAVAVYVNLPAPLPYPFTFRVYTRPGTARQGLDFERLDENVTILPGRKYTSFQLKIIGDDQREPDEKFTLVFDGYGYDAEFTIIDDDAPSSLPVVSILHADVLEGNETPGLVRFRVSLDKPSSDVVSVQYRTEDRTAIAEEDYVPQSGLLRFKPGERVKWIEVETVPDEQPEYEWEFFDVSIISTRHADAPFRYGSGRIRDDDFSRRWLRIHDTSAFEGTDAVFRVEMSRPADIPIKLRWAVAGQQGDSWIPGPGSTSFSDFATKAGSITFQPGEVLKEVRIALLDDAVPEQDEYFGLYLEPRPELTWDSRPGIAVIVDDDTEYEWPALLVEDVFAVEHDTGTAVALPLRLSRQAATAVQVVVVPRDQAATALLAAPRVVTFAPGETEKTVVLTVAGDDVAEPLQVFHFDFRDPTGVVVGRDAVTVSLIDDDRPPRDRAVRH
jgi:hypothetical protein